MNISVFRSAFDAYDNYIIDLYVQESYVTVLPKFFSDTKTPPIFEDIFPNNMAFMKAPLNTLVDIHSGGYTYQLLEPEKDIPNIIAYLKWMLEYLQPSRLSPTQLVAYNKVKDTYDFFNAGWTAKQKCLHPEKDKIIKFNKSGE